MKVIKIYKYNSSHSIKHYMVLIEGYDFNDDNDIDSIVDDWCESDPLGQNNGYSSCWEFIEDIDIIIRELKIAIFNIRNNIISLDNKGLKLEKYLNEKEN